MKKVSLTLFTLFSMAVSAQVGVGISLSNIDASAQLQIESTTKGLLAPRMTQIQRNSIETPATGLLVFQTDEKVGFYYFDGSIWKQNLGVLSGTANQVLTIDGSGVAGWTTPTGGGISAYEATDEFPATSSQIVFNLTQTPSATSKVKMYINGIRVSNDAYSVNGTTLTYDPILNGAYSVTVNDRIQFDYSY